MFAAGCVLFFLELESWDLLFFVFCTTTAFFSKHPCSQQKWQPTVLKQVFEFIGIYYSTRGSCLIFCRLQL